jgi:hypothetical protein
VHEEEGMVVWYISVGRLCYALPSPRAGMSWPVLSLKVLFAMVRVLGVVLLGVMWMEGWW